MMQKSSPPMRATTSVASTPRSIAATSTRTSSPIICPSDAFTSAKLSRLSRAHTKIEGICNAQTQGFAKRRQVNETGKCIVLHLIANAGDLIELIVALEDLRAEDIDERAIAFDKRGSLRVPRDANTRKRVVAPMRSGAPTYVVHAGRASALSEPIVVRPASKSSRSSEPSNVTPAPRSRSSYSSIM